MSDGFAQKRCQLRLRSPVIPELRCEECLVSIVAWTKILPRRIAHETGLVQSHLAFIYRYVCT